VNAWLARFRRPLAAAFAAAASGFALLTLRPPAAPTVPVLVAARDLPGGVTLHGGDLRSAALPAAAVPDGAVRSGATGRLLSGPLRRGEALTDVRLAGRDLLDGYGPGMVATPVRIADAGAVRLLHSGDRVDVLATADSPEGMVSPRPARAVAQGVPVLAVPGGASGAVGDQGALIVLATSRDQSAALAGAGARLSVTINGNQDRRTFP
jgi:Flp pilus assembly protein CpaB